MKKYIYIYIYKYIFLHLGDVFKDNNHFKKSESHVMNFYSKNSRIYFYEDLRPYCRNYKNERQKQ